MERESIRETIYDNLILDGAPGYLDWATGISRINACYTEWRGSPHRRQAKQVTDRDLELREFIIHEYAHFIQITTTGYLYRLAIRLYELLLQCVPQPEFVVPGPDLKPPEHVAAHLAELIGALHHVGPHKMTNLTIIESQAFYIQKAGTRRGVGHKHFVEMLDEAPSEEYRRAYDFAAERLGARAFKLFPVLTSLALCTLNPAKSFTKLVEAAAKLNLSYTRAAEPALFVKMSDDICEDFLGTSVDLVDQLPDHPIYTPVVIKLFKICSEPSFSVLSFLINLHKHQTKEMVLATLRPLMFNRDPTKKYTPMFIPLGFWDDKNPEEKEHDAHNLTLIAAISASFLRNIKPS